MPKGGQSFSTVAPLEYLLQRSKPAASGDGEPKREELNSPSMVYVVSMASLFSAAVKSSLLNTV